MNIQEYQKLAARTLPRLSNEQEDIQHMLFGMMTELGELVDTYKKHYAYGKELDMVNVMEEMGDIMWYWAGMCSITGVNPSAALQTNITKLLVRYPEKFEKELALTREVEQEIKAIVSKREELQYGDEEED